jgi:long-subunit fatty acid transport protein
LPKKNGRPQSNVLYYPNGAPTDAAVTAPPRLSTLSIQGAVLPDADRLQLSFRANWELSPASSLDLAYSWLHFNDASGNYTNNCDPLVMTCTANGETTRETREDAHAVD